MKNIVYKLIDPRTSEVRYIGKSEQGVSRLLEHLKPSSLKKNTHKDRWIKQLLALDLTPGFEILETVSNPNDLFEAEEKWYRYYLALGAYLTNSTECGKGTRGYKHKEETIILLKEKAALRDLAPYANPVNKKPHKVVDGVECRHCFKCDSYKSLQAFNWAKKRERYHSYCKSCVLSYQIQRREKNPAPTLSPEAFNASRLPGAKAGGEASKRPERRAQVALQRSKAIRAENLLTEEILEFSSALAAKEKGFQNSNIGQAIKYKQPYKGFLWTFISPSDKINK